MPASQAACEMIDFSGRWLGEFQLNRIRWQPGMRARYNPTGRTGHEHFPALIITNRATSYCAGESYAMHYGYSGGHSMIAEELPDGRRQIQFGNAKGSANEPIRLMRTAPLYLTFSSEGINGCARSMQRLVRKHLVDFPQKGRPRPVHYNCWEAVYFDHKPEQLIDIAKRVAALGAERFVLDDGWFGERDDDTSSLADWYLDKRKYPQGLKPLIEQVHNLGMTFGLWFEPEMISPDSKAYRAHPRWAMGAADQVTGRNQKVLDMSQPVVWQYVFDRVAKILNSHDIDYIKWDHNRVLPYPDDNQIRMVYKLIDKLRQAFPQVEIESCASGGGRADYGMLERTHRVWLSDSNDALERARIQHGAALFLPAVVTGSHVGPRSCHTSGRVLSMQFRAWIAAQRHMGFEMDPRELTDEETRVLKRVVDWWKQNRNWLMRADIYLLDVDDEAILAEMHMAEDGSQFVVFINRTDSSRQIAPRPVRLTALESDTTYSTELVNAEDVSSLSRGQPAIRQGKLTASGRYFCSHGIILPVSAPQSTLVLSGQRETG